MKPLQKAPAPTERQESIAVVGIDAGGTFTDCVFQHVDGSRETLKVPSTPSQPEDAILRALALLKIPNSVSLHHGTTVGTNALLESTGGRIVLIVNEGFGDILTLRRQSRRDLYELYPTIPRTPLSETQVVECPVRLDFSGNRIVKEPNWVEFVKRHQEIFEASDGIAICFLHACRHPNDEYALRDAIKIQCKEIPITISSQLVAENAEYERAVASTLNAYLGMPVGQYLDRLNKRLPETTIEIMGSFGGLLDLCVARAEPIHTVLEWSFRWLPRGKDCCYAIRNQRCLKLRYGGHLNRHCGDQRP